MNLPFFIAKRYLFSKKKQNIINIISAVSVAGIVVGSMAIVIVTSVLNGFNDLMGQFYSSFDPDIKITAVEGKMFDPSKSSFKQIESHEDVVHYAEIVEGMALLKYDSQISVAVVKGVPDNYNQYTSIDSLLVDGEYVLHDKGIDYGIVGRGVAYNLGVGLSFVDHIMIYVPKKGKQVSINPTKSINQNYLFPSGIFAVLDEIDSKYVIVDKAFATDLFESKQEISSVELDINNDADMDKVQAEIQEILGPAFHVKNKRQQHDLVFKTMKSEKWWVYVILVFILILTSGNMIGNLTMLFIDKKEDIQILLSMGAKIGQIRRIFLFNGWLISLLGAIIGSILGIFICWIQMEFAIVKFPVPEGSFIVPGYPVEIVFSDVFLAFFTVLFIGFVVSWYPVRFISNKYLLQTNL